MTKRENYVVTLDWLGESAAAIKVSEDGGSTVVWLPKSQVEYERDEHKGTVEVEVPEWLAKDKGLI